MSSNVENRIVKMEFQNSKFTQAANSTMATLSNLSKKLKLAEGVQGLANVAAAAKNINLDPLGAGAEAASGKLSAMGIAGVTALVNITNRAVDAGIAFGKSLTVDPIMDGLKEYETKMNAIQTIMTNTASKGTTLEDINGALAELNTYSDQTIYNFAQMTDNIGKATAAGVGLEDSVTFVKGLANVAAGFGVDAMSMAGATQQMTQALASGTVRLQDWMSMENRGMGGEMIQKELLATARAMGVHVDTSEGFRYSLEQNWLSSEVFIKTMEKMANRQDLVDAATKVKTFTQLVDVMKEAVGSGWAVSWENIIGDKNESTELFTSISDGFSNIAGSMADYRNDALTLWKDLGGRDDLLMGLRQALYGIGNVVGPIYNAFKKVFDPWNGRVLADLSKGFEQLMRKMAVSHATGEKIGATFEAFFNIVKVILSPLKLLGSFLVGIMGAGGGLIDTIFSITGGIGGWINKIAEWVDKSKLMLKLMDKASELGNSVGDAFRSMFNGMSGAISGGVDSINVWASEAADSMGLVAGETKKNVAIIKANVLEFMEVHQPLQKMIDFFNKLKTEVSEAIQTVKDKYSDATRGISKASDGLAGAFEKVLIGTEAFVSFLGDASKRIKDLFDGITQNVKDADLTGTDVMNIGLFGIIATGVYKLFGFIKELKEGSSSVLGAVKKFFDSGAGMFKSMSASLNEVKGCLEAYQKDLKSDRILKIAGAIGILALSVFLLSRIDTEKLIPATGALIVLGAGLVGAIKLLEGYSSESFKDSIGLFLGAIGFAMAANILASALIKLSKLGWKDIAKGVVGLTSIMVLLGGAMKAIDKFDLSLDAGTAGSLILLGIGLTVMAGALKVMSLIDLPSMGRGLLGIGGVMLAVGVFARLVKGVGVDIMLASVAMNLMSMALLSMSGVLAIYSLFDPGAVSYAGGLIAIILSSIVLFGKLVKSCGGDLLKATVAMTVLAHALTLLSGAILIYSKISWLDFASGLGKMAIMVSALGMGLKLFPKNIAFQAAGLLALVVAVVKLTKCLKSLAGLSWEDIGKGMVALAGMFVILGVAAALVGPLAPALLILAAAIGVLGFSVMLVAGGLALFAMAMTAAAGSTIAGAASMAGALLSLSAVLPVITAAIALAIASFITVLGYNMPSLTKALTAIIKGLCATIIACAPDLALAAGALIVAFCDALIMGIPKVMETIAVWISSLLTMLSSNLESVGNFVLEFLLMLIDVVVTFIVERSAIIAEAIATLIVNTLTVMAEYVPKMAEAGISLITGLVVAMIEGTLSMTIQVVDAILRFLNSLADVIEEKAPQFAAAGAKILGAIISAFATIGGQALGIAKEFGGKLLSGILGVVSPVLNAARNVAKGIMTAFKNLPREALDVGKNIINGMKNGISNGIESVKQAARNVASSALSAAKKFLDIHSPSRKFAEIGEYSDAGFVKGLEGGAKDVEDASIGVADGALSGMRNAMAEASSILEVDDTLSPVIKPVVDLTEVQNGASKMGSMMPKDYRLNMKANVSGAGKAGSSMNSKTDKLSNSSGNTTNNTTNETTNHFHISGAQDPNTIAEKVSKILDNQVKRRSAVWA